MSAEFSMLASWPCPASWYLLPYHRAGGWYASFGRCKSCKFTTSLRDELNNQQMAREYIFVHLFSNRTASEFKLLSFGGLKRCLTLTHHITRLVQTQHKLDKNHQNSLSFHDHLWFGRNKILHLQCKATNYSRLPSANRDAELHGYMLTAASQRWQHQEKSSESVSKVGGSKELCCPRQLLCWLWNLTISYKCLLCSSQVSHSTRTVRAWASMHSASHLKPKQSSWTLLPLVMSFNTCAFLLWGVNTYLSSVQPAAFYNFSQAALDFCLYLIWPICRSMTLTRHYAYFHRASVWMLAKNIWKIILMYEPSRSQKLNGRYSGFSQGTCVHCLAFSHSA